MNEHVTLATNDAYDVDVHAWARRQAELLRQQRFAEIDLDNVVEEIESLGNEQAHGIESHLIVLVEHLLKLAVSTDADPRQGWRRSVRNARSQIARRLKRNPSLRRELPVYYGEEWPTMREAAADGLRDDDAKRLPAAAPFSPAEVLDPAFFPGG